MVTVTIQWDFSSEEQKQMHNQQQTTNNNRTTTNNKSTYNLLHALYLSLALSRALRRLHSFAQVEQALAGLGLLVLAIFVIGVDVVTEKEAQARSQHWRVSRETCCAHNVDGFSVTPDFLAIELDDDAKGLAYGGGILVLHSTTTDKILLCVW